MENKGGIEIKELGLLMSENLSNIWNQLNSTGRSEFLKMVGHNIKEYRSLKNSITKELYPSLAYTFAQEAQKFIDSRIASEQVHSIQCRKGCSYCCYVKNDITDDEAALLLQESRRLGIKIDIDRLQIQVGSNGDFKRIGYPDRKCVFLDETGSCAVYEFRPITCRKMLVVNDPGNCDTENNYGAQVQRIIDIDAEAIGCVTANATKSGMMAEMLLEQIDISEEEMTIIQ